MIARPAPAAAGRAVWTTAAAVVAAVMGFAPDARAQSGAEPFVVAVGGRVNMFTFARHDTDAPTAPVEKTNPTGIFTYSRLTIEARAALGDGWTARGVARFIANPRQPDNTDEVYIELAGPAGRFQVGDRQAVNAVMIGAAAPQAFVDSSDEIIASAVRPRTEITQRDAMTFKRYSRGSTALVYQSPRWNTLQIGLGYYPGGTAAISTAQRVRTRNTVEATLSHVGQVTESVRYRLIAGRFSADTPLGPGGIDAWNVAASVYAGSVEVSGAVMTVAPILGLRERQWTVGAQYRSGPWELSADFRRSAHRQAEDGALHEAVERTQLQASYRLAPGIEVGGGLFHAFQRDRLAQVWRSRGALLGITVGF